MANESEKCSNAKLQYKNSNRTYFFVFSSDPYSSDVIEPELEPQYYGISRARTGPIVKSDIRENVTKQLKSMFEQIQNRNEELLYLKMHKTTRDAFRIYFSYEVSYIPKNISDEDKLVGKVLGCIYGVKIIEDSSLNYAVVQPVINAMSQHKGIENIRHKFETIFTKM
jgi:hypothetical protein